MKISLEKVCKYDLSNVLDRVYKGWSSEAYTLEKTYPYKFYSYLADQYTNSLILDLGTSEGASAIATAAHALERNNYVITVDIEDKRLFNLVGLPISFIKIGANDPIIKWLIPQAKLILLDIDHRGIEERKFYDTLLEIGWKGILVVDDICLPEANHPMRGFWESIKEPKYDLTKWCHWSGTGLVDLLGNVIIEE